jgi:hypothetical protein
MHYYNVCPPSADENLVAAWDSQLRQLKTSWIEQLIAERGQDLFQRFASSYAELKALPRGARRAVQRRLTQPDNVGEISTEWRRKLACTVAGAALLIALGQTAEAGGVKVSTIKLGTKCTLPNAISAANYAELIQQPFNKKTAYNYGFYYHGCKAAPGPNIIVLPKTAYTMQSPVTILSPIIIQGAKPKKPQKGQSFLPGTGGTLHAPAGSAAFYVYGGGSLSLYNVTVTGGSTTGYGGVIYNGDGGSVSLTISTISGASALRGGGIFNRGDLTIAGSTISNNAAYYGGGVFSYGNLTVASSTILGTIVQSTVSGNTADYDGGGIYNAGAATVTNTTISNNTASKNGGGIANTSAGSLAIMNSTMSGNAAYNGGGLHNDYILTLTSSTISNSTANFGGGLFNAVGGNADLTGSTFSQNDASVAKVILNEKSYYYGGKGGGIYNLGGLAINTSVISGNTADGKTVVPVDDYNNPLPPINFGGMGGGIYNKGDVNVYTGSSITTNIAAYFGGGLFNYGASTCYAATGTISGNGNPPADALKGPDIYPPPP